MRKRIGWILVAMGLMVSLLWVAGHPPAQAGEDNKTQQTLDKILQNQEKMMQDLDWIKKELDIIRIRAR